MLDDDYSNLFEHNCSHCCYFKITVCLNNNSKHNCFKHSYFKTMVILNNNYTKQKLLFRKKLSEATLLLISELILLLIL